MAKVILYSVDLSPPCRSVLLTAHAIGLNLDIRKVDLLKGDQLSAEFKKMNPQHSIPTMNDNGFILWDSHAIVCYLIDKYAKDDSLYPKDLKKRSLINQRLYFDTGNLFATFRPCCRTLIIEHKQTVSTEKMECMKEAFDILELMLEGKKWLAGDSYTIADICCVTTVSSAEVLLNLDAYPNMKGWLKRCEEQIPGYQKYNVPGMKGLHELMQSKRS